MPPSNKKKQRSTEMDTFTVAVREAEEGGYWGEVIELPGCASQGETLDELMLNISDAIVACLEVHMEDEGWHERQTISTMTVRVPIPG